MLMGKKDKFIKLKEKNKSMKNLQVKKKMILVSFQLTQPKDYVKT